MDEIDDAAEQELEDMRKYAPRRNGYEMVLDEVSKHGDGDVLENVKQYLIGSIENQRPVSKSQAAKRARTWLTRGGHGIPASSPLHRASSVH